MYLYRLFDLNPKIQTHTYLSLAQILQEFLTLSNNLFSNIFSNAIKYGNNEVIITVSNNEDKNATISIEDNGPGIKDKEAIFNLYSQEDNDLLKRTAKGTGVGLYFMKLLCDDLNISYKVEDRDIGAGTKFTLVFNNKADKGIRQYECINC